MKWVHSLSSQHPTKKKKKKVKIQQQLNKKICTPSLHKYEKQLPGREIGRDRKLLSKYHASLPCRTLQWLSIFLNVKAQVLKMSSWPLQSLTPTNLLTSLPTSLDGLLILLQTCQSLFQCWAFAFIVLWPRELFPLIAWLIPLLSSSPQFICHLIRGPFRPPYSQY